MNVSATLLKKIILIVFLFYSYQSANAKDDARENMKAGERLYKNGDFITATEKFQAATETEKLSPAPAHYNAGNALYRQKLYDEAAQEYRSALRSPDLDIQSKAYFNAGNAYFQQSSQAEAGQDLQNAAQLMEQAVTSYEQSILLNSSDDAAKANCELAVKKANILKELMQQQQCQNDNKDQDKENEKEENKNQEDQKNQQENSDQQNQQQKDEQQEQQKQQQQEQGSEGENSENKETQQQQPQSAEEMTKEEAERLLDAMKEDEKSQRKALQMMLGKPVPVDKNW